MKGNHRINIFTGHFGSGKTEVAVNYALKLSRENKKTVIADLDIINPFFRTKDAETYLESKGIKVITTVYANTNVDVPAIPAEINMIFENDDIHAVLDIGGNDEGARAVSRFRDEIKRVGYQMYFVVNTRRPMTDTPEKILKMLYEIQNSAGVNVSGFVNNTNILDDTTSECILEGGRIIKAASKISGIPISFTSGLKKAISDTRKQTDTKKYFTIERRIRLPWDVR